MEAILNAIASILTGVWDRIVDIKEATVGAVKYSIVWIKKLLISIVDFVLWVYHAFIDFFPWFFNLLAALFEALGNLIEDTLSYVFEEFLKLSIYLLSNIPGVEQISDFAQYYSQLPAEVLNIMGLIGISTATEIIISAIGIRLILQIIPFTRLGS
jgi:hypothetical protein